MFKRERTKMAGWLMIAVLTITAFGAVKLNVEAVIPSKTSYHVYLSGNDVFVRNEKTAGSKIGTEYYMKYTVKDVERLPAQHGLCGTSDPTLTYAYEKGFMRYSNYSAERETENLLLKGATYYIQFKIAEGCFTYKIMREKDGKTENMYITSPIGDGENMTHFGLWFGVSTLRAELTNVLFYDKDGNDLGVKVSNGDGVAIPTGKVIEKDTEIDHRYEVIVDNKNHIAISHVKEATSNIVYMEYKVKSADYQFQQEGVVLSSKPLNGYPHSAGTIQYNGYDPATDNVELLDVGAEYIIWMEKGKDGKDFSTYVQKTKDGEVSYYVFDSKNQEKADENASTFCLWFGESTSGSFHLEDVKFYDENKNNLKVQCNQNITIIHHGSLEDYAGCEATYYCRETEDSFALYKDQKLKFTKDGVVSEGTYHISDNVMTLEMNEETLKYDYLYAKITDNDQNVYDRLYNYKVEFVTGSETEIETQELSNQTGYIAQRPNDPVFEDYDFVEWCLEDGTAFDFEKLVTESVILYAKYSGDGTTYLAEPNDVSDNSEFAWIVGGVLLVVAAGVVCVICIRKGGR